MAAWLIAFWVKPEQSGDSGLTSTRYIAAAIFMSNVTSWDSTLFQAGLSYVGAPLKITAIIALIVGICFLGYGVFQESQKQDK